MDTCALGLKAAARIFENSEIKTFVKNRYISWEGDVGKKLLNKDIDLDQIYKWVEDNNINPKPISGKQELLEDFINNKSIRQLI